MMEIVDDAVARIVLAMDDGDSINRVCEKIGQSYSWTYEWVQTLEDLGIVERLDRGFRVTDDEMRTAFLHVVQATSAYGIDRDEAYVLPHFSGMDFAFTGIDAAYVWTEGGYQVARDYTDYPVFLAVGADELDAWQDFFAACSVDAFVEERDGEGIYYVLSPVEGVDREWVDGSPAIPLQEAIEWMVRYRASFQPALEIIAEQYGHRPSVREALDREAVAL